MKKRVLVAMSGGVDSSVACFLLKQKGYKVAGITMDMGRKAPVRQAKKMCKALGVPHHVVDVKKRLERRVIKNFIDEYKKGKTPNPCVACNKHLKFSFLVKKALSLGFDFFATGHYANIEKNKKGYLLKNGKDTAKNQAYFLYPIRKDYLKHIIFPLGDLTKEKVKNIAKKADLPVDTENQSQDICFIPGKDYRSFLLGKIKKKIKPGNILDLKGSVIGRHKGVPFYTVGQRGGMGIGAAHPLYVISVDPRKNLVIAGEKKDLRSRGLMAGSLNRFVANFPKDVYARIRYAHRLAKCTVLVYNNGGFKVLFKRKQEAVTPGQSVVLYDDTGNVLGGGIIERVLK